MGDTVKIIHTGYQYTTYIEMAVWLGADMAPYIREQYEKSGGSFRAFNSAKARGYKNHKWIYDYEASRLDICRVNNIDGSGQHFLLERIYDGRQFVFGPEGLKVIKKGEMFDDKDFLI